MRVHTLLQTTMTEHGDQHTFIRKEKFQIQGLSKKKVYQSGRQYAIFRHAACTFTK